MVSQEAESGRQPGAGPRLAGWAALCQAGSRCFAALLAAPAQ